MYDTILVPTDGSDHAVRAAEHAGRLASSSGATVHLLAAVDVQRAGGLFSAGGVGEEFVARLEEEADAALDAVRGAVGDGEVRTAVVRGEPSEAILDYAADHGVGLVAMGTHGRSGVRRYIAGSVTERVLRLADAPVLTVRDTERSRTGDDYEEILVPTDGSAAAEAAAEHAVAVAERTAARVHAVNVVDVAGLVGDPEVGLSPDLVDEIHADGEAAAESVTAAAHEAGLVAVSAVLEGRPAAELLGYAEDHDVDLVAMGSAGRTGLDRYLLGSTTEQVVRRADVPVLAVKPPE